jgi:hypothetical protein
MLGVHKKIQVTPAAHLILALCNSLKEVDSDL